MINVMMTDDIRKYETKQFGPFTTRQMVCVMLGLAIGIPIGFAVPTSISNRVLIMAILATPIIAAGYVKMDGMKFEVIICRFIYAMLLTPKKRKYKSENTYRIKLDRINAARERKMLKGMSEAKRKRYIERKKKHIVKYSSKRAYKIYT